MEKKMSRPERAAVLVIFALLAFLPCLALSLFTGTGILNLDAWQTPWNDEIVYWRNVRMLRKYLIPQGVIGFNESAARHLTYGPYSFITYLPYYLLSFITGCDSHNYIYLINVLMTALGFFFFALLARPDRTQTVWITVFVITHVVAARYTWSGMTEPSYTFFLLVITGMAFDLNRQEAEGKRLSAGVIVLMSGMIFLWTLMRPFYITLFLLAAWYAYRAAAGREAGRPARVLAPAVVLALIPITFGIYLYIRDNYMARYFSGISVVGNLAGLLTGGPANLVRVMWAANVSALKVIYQNPADGSWMATVTTIFAGEWLLLFGLWIRKLCRKERGSQRVFLFIMLLSAALVYEGTIVLYKPDAIFRMILAFSVTMGLVILIELGTEKKTWRTVISLCFVLFTAGLSAYSLRTNTNGLKLPQRRADYSEASEISLTDALEEAMPRSEEDPWANTVVRPIFQKKLYRYIFSSPAWTAMNVCQDRVLIEKVENDSFSSRYLMMPKGYNLEGYALYDRCREKYRVVWEDKKVVIFLTQDGTDSA